MMVEWDFIEFPEGMLQTNYQYSWDCGNYQYYDSIVYSIIVQYNPSTIGNSRLVIVYSLMDYYSIQHYSRTDCYNVYGTSIGLDYINGIIVIIGCIVCIIEIQYSDILYFSILQHYGLYSIIMPVLY